MNVWIHSYLLGTTYLVYVPTSPIQKLISSYVDARALIFSFSIPHTLHTLSYLLCRRLVGRTYLTVVMRYAPRTYPSCPGAKELV